MGKTTKETAVFFSAKEAAALLGISYQGFVQRREKPEPDARIGKHVGWTKETLLAWDATVKKTPGRAPSKARKVV